MYYVDLTSPFPSTHPHYETGRSDDGREENGRPGEGRNRHNPRAPFPFHSWPLSRSTGSCSKFTPHFPRAVETDRSVRATAARSRAGQQVPGPDCRSNSRAARRSKEAASAFSLGWWRIGESRSSWPLPRSAACSWRATTLIVNEPAISGAHACAPSPSSRFTVCSVWLELGLEASAVE